MVKLLKYKPQRTAYSLSVLVWSVPGAVMIFGSAQLTPKDLKRRIQRSSAKCVVTDSSTADKVDAVSSSDDSFDCRRDNELSETVSVNSFTEICVAQIRCCGPATYRWSEGLLDESITGSNNPRL